MAATTQRVVRIYANALYTAAEKADQVERVAEDLRMVRSTIQHNESLKRVLIDGLTTDEPKKRVITKLFGPHVNTVTLQFLEVLVDKRREDVMETIDTAFRHVVDERTGVVRAQVTSAVPLTPDELEKAKNAIKQMTGKRVEVEQRIDKSIIGGLIVRVGDRLMDGSVTGQLAILKKSLAGTAR